MNKIKKFVIIKMLEVFKERGCNSIEDIIELLNKELKNDNDVVFSWKIGE